jgi:peptide/nickel transport system permease protein
MTRYIVFRLLALVPILLGTSFVSFGLIHLVPGDPVVAMLGLEADAQSIATLRAKLALDQPFLVQYAAWLGQVVTGDFGRSIQGERQVLPLVLKALVPSGQLALAALAVSLLIAIPAGIVAARYRNTLRDYAASFVALCGLSLPSFWLGVLLILTLSIQFPLFPSSGYVAPLEDPLGHLRHLALPALTLGAALAAATMRMTRATMIEVLRSDYIRTARAKGVPRRAQGRLAAWPAQHDDPARDSDRHPARPVARRRGRDRDRLRLAGHRQADGRRDLRARLPGRAGDDPDDGGDLRGAEPDHRPRLRLPRSADPVRVSAPVLAPARRGVWRAALADPRTALGLAIVALVVVAALFAPWLAPFDPNHPDFGAALAPPGAPYWLGGTISAATCSRASSTARAPRCSSAS